MSEERSNAPEECNTTLLAQDAKLGDPQAREVLFGRYLHRAQRFFARRMPRHARRGGQDEDLAQEAAAKAARNLERFEPRERGSFGRWFWTIAENVLKDWGRRSARAPVIDRLPDTTTGDFEASQLSHSEVFLRKEVLELFEGELRDVSARERRALEMHIKEGLDYPTIARECGYPTDNAARMAVTRALAELALRLSDKERHPK